MDELVKAVVEKTGLPEATAKTVVDLVFDYLAKKLRGPIGSQIESLRKGGGLAAMAKEFTEKLGKKKE